MIDAHTKLCCIIGNPVKHSRSPQMHNAGYQALNLNFVFLAFKVENVKQAIIGLRAISARGIVVTVPHKIEVMNYVDQIDDTAQTIGAVNTIVNDHGILKASNTDWIGALKALEEKIPVKDKTVALLGAGGAARAVAFGLIKNGARIFVFNRTIERAKELVNKFGLVNALSLKDTAKIKSADIIINTTSVGMEPDIDHSPIPIECLKKQHVVFDAIYTPRETKLVKLAKRIGASVVYGDRMVLNTVMPQFELFTGKIAPKEVLGKALEDALRSR